MTDESSIACGSFWSQELVTRDWNHLNIWVFLDFPQKCFSEIRMGAFLMQTLIYAIHFDFF